MHKITLRLNIFVVLKVKFSVIYYVVFTVKDTEVKRPTSVMADAKLCYFFKVEKTVSSVTVHWPLFMGKTAAGSRF